MTLTKEQLDAINEGDALRAHDSKLQQLRAQRDEARAVARHYYQWNRSALRYRERVDEISFHWEDRAKKAEHERDEARRHVRELLHALDRQSDCDGNANLSWRVRFAMKEARKYLKGEGNGEN